jgi:hypothetical protein
MSASAVAVAAGAAAGDRAGAAGDRAGAAAAAARSVGDGLQCSSSDPSAAAGLSSAAAVDVDALAAEVARISFPGLKPPSPATSPPRSPHVSPQRPWRPHGESSIVYTQRGPAVEADSTASSPFGVMDGVAPDGAPRVLEDHEYHRAVLISHCRRDPATLNATYALISALRVGRDASGLPFSRHCHMDSRRVELWTDSEQLAEQGGQDWNEPILRAMREGVSTIFFVGNAFAGSTNCVREVNWAVRKFKHKALPVFLEWFCDDQASFDRWLRARPAGAGVMDEELRGFRAWRYKADNVGFYLEDKQSVPANLFDMSAFVCDMCRATARDDKVCPSCSNWSTATQKAFGPKLVEAARRLGKFIDTKVDMKIMQAEAQEQDELERTSSSQGMASDETAPAEPMQRKGLRDSC